MYFLIEEYEKAKYEDQKFIAALNGVDLDKEIGYEGQQKNENGEATGKTKSRGLFKDPKEYEKMSPEERKAETDRIMKVIRAAGLPIPIKETKVNKDD